MSKSWEREREKGWEGTKEDFWGQLPNEGTREQKKNPPSILSGGQRPAPGENQSRMGGLARGRPTASRGEAATAARNPGLFMFHILTMGRP